MVSSFDTITVENDMTKTYQYKAHSIISSDPTACPIISCTLGKHDGGIYDGNIYLKITSDNSYSTVQFKSSDEWGYNQKASITCSNSAGKSKQQVVTLILKASACTTAL